MATATCTAACLVPAGLGAASGRRLTGEPSAALMSFTAPPSTQRKQQDGGPVHPALAAVQALENAGGRAGAAQPQEAE